MEDFGSKIWKITKIRINEAITMIPSTLSLTPITLPQSMSLWSVSETFLSR
jgi:hypothetical protein